eukprot:5253019-Prymnesium_polylepis.1
MGANFIPVPRDRSLGLSVVVQKAAAQQLRADSNRRGDLRADASDSGRPATWLQAEPNVREVASRVGKVERLTRLHAKIVRLAAPVACTKALKALHRFVGRQHARD